MQSCPVALKKEQHKKCNRKSVVGENVDIGDGPHKIVRRPPYHSPDIDWGE